VSKIEEGALRAGALTRYVAFQSNTPTRNLAGEAVDAWTTYENAWVSINPLSGRELMVAQQSQSTVTHRIERRYSALVSANHHILFGTRTFEINSIVNEDEGDHKLILMCTEVK